MLAHAALRTQRTKLKKPTMKIKILLVATFACALPICSAHGPLAPASALAIPDSGLARLDAELAGDWRHASNGDGFEFLADGTYVFHSGKAKKRAGSVSHWGTWTVSDYSTPSEDILRAAATLHLRTTNRVLSKNGRRRMEPFKRLLSVPVVFTEADGHVIINNIAYWKKGFGPG